MARKKWFESSTSKEEAEWYQNHFHPLFKKDSAETGLFDFANEVQLKGANKTFVEGVADRIKNEIKNSGRSEDLRVRLAGGFALSLLNHNNDAKSFEEMLQTDIEPIIPFATLLKFPTTKEPLDFEEVYLFLNSVTFLAAAALPFYLDPMNDRTRVKVFFLKCFQLFKRFESILSQDSPNLAEKFRGYMDAYLTDSPYIPDVGELLVRLKNYSRPKDADAAAFGKIEARITSDMEIFALNERVLKLSSGLKRDLAVAYLQYLPDMWAAHFGKEANPSKLDSRIAKRVIGLVLYCCESLDVFNPSNKGADDFLHYRERLSFAIRSLRSDGGNCEVCEKKAQLKCGKCQFTRYCSAPCQKGAWGLHKLTCGKADVTKMKEELVKAPFWPKVSLSGETIQIVL